MSNPLFDRFNSGFQQSRNPLANAFQMAAMFRQIQKDSRQIPKLLLDNNRINQQQYEQLLKFDGNTEQMGRYLLQSGAITKGQLESIKSILPQFQELIK